ncbi:MAG: DUF3025 domain-containing protein [Xenophilus sp.]
MPLAVDWSAPWMQPWRGLTPLPAGERGPVAVLLGQLTASRTNGPAFVPHRALPPSEPYESFIHRTATIPTRDNLHDFFNGLVWLAFPQAKRRLNELQAAEIARRGVGPTRGPLRDALTLFDEHGAVLDAPPALWHALRARDWRRLFLDLRPLWSGARVRVFGHALLEKLLAGQKSATAHVLLGPDAGDPSIAPGDAAIAAALDPQRLAGKPFTPLPVAGIPGWHPGNCEPAFYDDAEVFRPRRPLEADRPAPN